MGLKTRGFAMGGWVGGWLGPVRAVQFGELLSGLVQILRLQQSCSRKLKARYSGSLLGEAEWCPPTLLVPSDGALNAGDDVFPSLWSALRRPTFHLLLGGRNSPGCGDKGRTFGSLCTVNQLSAILPGVAHPAAPPRVPTATCF